MQHPGTVVVESYTQSFSKSPLLMKWHELDLSHLSFDVFILHIAFVLALSPLQQPGSSVVVVVVLVVITQSFGSSVSIQLQPFDSQLAYSPAMNSHLFERSH